MKRSPDKPISLAYITRNVCRLSDSTGTSTPEEKALCDDVRSVEAAYTEGYDIVEGGGGADVDQADEAGDQRRYQDGEERDCGLGLNLQGVSQRIRETIRRGDGQTDLAHGSPARKASIACKSPDQAGCRGQEGNGPGSIHYDDDSNQDRSSGFGARCIVEDLHKRIAQNSGRTRQNCRDIRCDEEYGDDNRKPERSVEDSSREHRPRYHDLGILGFLSHMDSAIASEHCKNVTDETYEKW